MTSSAPLRILVIEDHADSAEALSRLLQRLGYEVVLAAAGEEGLARAKDAPTDVVLCDLSLPGELSGYDVARRLRGDPATSRALLVALTGYGGAQEEQRCREAGFDVHFTKPVDVGALEGALRSGGMGGSG